MDIISDYRYVVFAEEAIKKGSISEHLCMMLSDSGFSGRYKTIAIENHIVKQATVSEQLHLLGLDAENLIQAEKRQKLLL